MSHFTKLEKAKITDVPAFVKACRELFPDAQVKEKAEARGYMGNKMKADVVVTGLNYDFALTRNSDGSFDMTADWWGLRGDLRKRKLCGKFKRDEDLQNFLLRTTTKNAIVDRYAAQGFTATVLEDEQENLNVTLERSY